MAERHIRTLKSELSTILRAQDSTKDRLAKFRWLKLLPAVVARHNARPAGKTSFKRCDVDSANFHAYLDEKHGGLVGGATGGKAGASYDATMAFNSSRIDYSSAGPTLRRCFVYAPGDKVIITRRSSKPKEIFSKISVRGAWDPTEHKVVHAQLRTSTTGDYVQGERARRPRYLDIVTLNDVLIFFIVYKIARVQGKDGKEQEAEEVPGWFGIDEMAAFPKEN